MAYVGANDSILTSIKKLLGLDSSYTEFDTDIIIHINSVFSILNQLGVGPESGFAITGNTETWSQYIGNDLEIRDVISYMYMRVKLLFDPPNNSSILNSYQEMIKEFEWRLNVAVDPGETG